MVFFPSDLDEPDDDRAEDDVEQQFKQEVSADQAENHVVAHTGEAHRGGPLGDGGHKKEQAAHKKDAGVHHGARNRSRDRSEKTTPFFRLCD